MIYFVSSFGLYLGARQKTMPVWVLSLGLVNSIFIRVESYVDPQGECCLACEYIVDMGVHFSP